MDDTAEKIFPAFLRLARRSDRDEQLWRISEDDIPSELVCRRVSRRGTDHYHLEPRFPMSLKQYEILLAGTRDAWDVHYIEPLETT